MTTPVSALEMCLSRWSDLSAWVSQPPSSQVRNCKTIGLFSDWITTANRQREWNRFTLSSHPTSMSCQFLVNANWVNFPNLGPLSKFAKKKSFITRLSLRERERERQVLQMASGCLLTFLSFVFLTHILIASAVNRHSKTNGKGTQGCQSFPQHF